MIIKENDLGNGPTGSHLSCTENESSKSSSSQLSSHSESRPLFLVAAVVKVGSDLIVAPYVSEVSQSGFALCQLCVSVCVSRWICRANLEQRTLQIHHPLLMLIK